MRRLGLFLFYDRDGKISDHIVYLLSKFSEHLERTIVVSNGPLAEGEASRIEPYVSQILVRPNVGFDVGGYIDGLKAIGFDTLEDYDELVLFNYTVFGPVFDLGEMFDRMASRDVDLWGLTQYADKNKEFLQSYFLVTRRRLHASPHFREYWLNMPEINSIDDSIHLHEFRFTPYFVDRGYKKGVYVENEEKWRGNTTLVDLRALLSKRPPLIKYRAFNFDPLAMERRGGLPASFNFRVMEDQTEYPVDMIWKYILSQSTSDQIIDGITGTRITTETGGPSNVSCVDGSQKPIVFLSVEQEESLEAIAGYLAFIEKERIYLVSSKENIVQRAKKLGWTSRSSKQPMTGLPIAAYSDQITEIVSPEDVVYNLSCLVEDRNDYYFRQIATDEYWGPLISSAEAIQRVYHQFKENPRVGLLFAPTNSMVGRIRRAEPLCPRASNWTFDSYPSDVRNAPAQSRWPWRGNVALSGRLTLSPGYVTRLAELNQQMKPVKAQKPCGVEGFMAELARQAGFASALVVSATQAMKLATRHSSDETHARQLVSQQAERLNIEIAELRVALEKANSATKHPRSAVPAAKTTPSNKKSAKGKSFLSHLTTSAIRKALLFSNLLKLSRK
ncbi:rhamnan synthesis protein F [Rhizobium azibense]|nr:rhamnan synthesis protein F [Rhizobium azibense]